VTEPPVTACTLAVRRLEVCNRTGHPLTVTVAGGRPLAVPPGTWRYTP
jgi:hypothetical protein